MSSGKPDWTIALPPKIEITFQKIPACPEGFFMGERGGLAAEEPRHRVVIPAGFYLGTIPVTQRQFDVWTGSEAYLEWFKAYGRERCNDGKPHNSHFEKKPDHPAKQLTWHEANEYAEWLSLIYAQYLPGGYTCCLPIEAEWEYACRGGTETEYWSGDGEVSLRGIGDYRGSCDGTMPAGELPANEHGLQDMHGNVWEWCRDVWDAHAYAKRKDGWIAKAWGLEEAGVHVEYWSEKDRERQDPPRVMRGGSWNFPAWDCRSAYRFGWRPGIRLRPRGFRLALVPGPVVEPQRGSGAPNQEEPGAGGRKPEGTGGVSPTAEGSVELHDLSRSRLPRNPRSG